MTIKLQNGSPVARVLPLNKFWQTNDPKWAGLYAFAPFHCGPVYVGKKATCIMRAAEYVATRYPGKLTTIAP